MVSRKKLLVFFDDFYVDDLYYLADGSDFAF